MILLNNEFSNPYIEESPFYEQFENIVKKMEEQPNNVLFKKIDKQMDIFNDEESDGLTQYAAEEMVFAIKIVLVKRDPEMRNTFLVVKKNDELIPEISTSGAPDKDDFMYERFRRTIRQKALTERTELIQELKELAEIYYNEPEAKNNARLCGDILVVKCAIEEIG